LNFNSSSVDNVIVEWDDVESEVIQTSPTIDNDGDDQYDSDFAYHFTLQPNTSIKLKNLDYGTADDIQFVLYDKDGELVPTMDGYYDYDYEEIDNKGFQFTYGDNYELLDHTIVTEDEEFVEIINGGDSDLEFYLEVVAVDEKESEDNGYFNDVNITFTVERTSNFATSDNQSVTIEVDESIYLSIVLLDSVIDVTIIVDQNLFLNITPNIPSFNTIFSTDIFDMSIVNIDPYNIPFLQNNSIDLVLTLPTKYECVFQELSEKIDIIALHTNTFGFPIIDGFFVLVPITFIDNVIVVCDKNYFIDSVFDLNITLLQQSPLNIGVDVFVKIDSTIHLNIFVNCGYGFYEDSSNVFDIFYDNSCEWLLSFENELTPVVNSDVYFSNPADEYHCDVLEDSSMFGSHLLTGKSDDHSALYVNMNYYSNYNYNKQYTISFQYRPKSENDAPLFYIGANQEDYVDCSAYIKIINGYFYVSIGDDYNNPTFENTNIAAIQDVIHFIAIIVDDVDVTYRINDYYKTFNFTAYKWLRGDSRVNFGYDFVSDSANDFDLDQIRLYSKCISNYEYSVLRYEIYYKSCRQEFSNIESVLSIPIYCYEPYTANIDCFIDNSILLLSECISEHIISTANYVQSISTPIRVSMTQPNYSGGITLSDTTEAINYLSTVIAQPIDIKLTMLYLKLGRNCYINTSSIIQKIEFLDIKKSDVIFTNSIFLKLSTNSNIAQPMINPRVVSIGDVVFSTPLYWSRNIEDIRYVQESSQTVDGNTIISIVKLKDFNVTATITTEQDFSITYDEYIKLSSIVTKDIYDIIFTDGTIIKAKFDLLNKPVKFTPIFNGYDRFYVTIKVLV